VLLTSLEWAVDLARTVRRPGLPNHVCGLAAYDAWADALEVDADYRTDGPAPAAAGEDGESQPVLEVRAMVHGDQATMLWERAEAAAFLRRMAEHAGDAAGLLAEAADLYERVGKTDVWPWGAKHFMAQEVQEGLQDARLRRELAASVRSAREWEEQATRRLESALGALGPAGP
jgi:hypothetical protein